MRRPLVAGNWKMNGSRELTRGLVAEIGADLPNDCGVDVVVCPPYVYLDMCSNLLESQSIALGAQDLDTHGPGAFTGAIAADMLLDVDCRFVIVGHSERRSLYGESDERVAEKAAVAAERGLIPIVCVGETQEEREDGVTEEVVHRQLDAVIRGAGIKIFPQALVAYEPVWAIGTGLTATAQQAQEVHQLIREQLSDASAEVARDTRVLYGGSVKPDNALGLFTQPDIDGGLIGGASLKAADFLGIIKAAIS
ncbi:MAG TPA: triose-phosphate isomerase [Gammaproteobacteria bacterium]|nr:triose-phosphate isomerase [Gammaproteobacteria bacterium]